MCDMLIKMDKIPLMAVIFHIHNSLSTSLLLIQSFLYIRVQYRNVTLAVGQE